MLGVLRKPVFRTLQVLNGNMRLATPDWPGDTAWVCNQLTAACGHCTLLRSDPKDVSGFEGKPAALSHQGPKDKRVLRVSKEGG